MICNCKGGHSAGCRSEAISEIVQDIVNGCTESNFLKENLCSKVELFGGKFYCHSQ